MSIVYLHTVQGRSFISMLFRFDSVNMMMLSPSVQLLVVTVLPFCPMRHVSADPLPGLLIPPPHPTPMCVLLYLDLGSLLPSGRTTFYTVLVHRATFTQHKYNRLCDAFCLPCTVCPHKQTFTLTLHI